MGAGVGRQAVMLLIVVDDRQQWTSKAWKDDGAG
jgi:hypothetical protein